MISYANAIGDYNSDGLPDIAVMNYNSYKSFLFENQSAGAPYIKIDLEGVMSNKDGIGCRIELFSADNYQNFYTHSGVGFQAQNSLNHIFGLANAEKFDSILIKWPSGHLDKLYEVASFQELHIIEGSTTEGEINIAEDVTILESDFPSSIYNLDFNHEMTVFPNPSQSEIFLCTNQKLTRIVIYDAQGNRVFKQRVSLKSKSRVDVSNLFAGVYFLVAYTNEGQLGNTTIIIQD